LAVLAAQGASGLEVYGWLGSLATYGFIVAYALVSVALPGYLRRHGTSPAGSRIIPTLAAVAMFVALVGNPCPMPQGPYAKLPYTYLAYLTAGLLWFVVLGRKRPITRTEC
jgi:amino acid transporter